MVGEEHGLKAVGRPDIHNCPVLWNEMREGPIDVQESKKFRLDLGPSIGIHFMEAVLLMFRDHLRDG